MNFQLLDQFPASLLIKSAAILILLFGVAFVRRSASAAWMSMWWRAGFSALLALSAFGFFSTRWHVLSPKAPVLNPAPLPVVMPNDFQNLEPAPLSPPAVLSRIEPSDWMRGAWALGLLFVLGHACAGAMRIHRLRASAAPVENRTWLRDLESEVNRFVLPGLVQLLVHREARVPFVTGLLRPAIILPFDFAHWDERQRLAVLRHELAHIRHRDIAWQWLSTIAGALLWVNPLVWLARRQLVLAQERAADDAVVLAGMNEFDYAEFLAATARRARGFGIEFAIAPMARPSTVGRRVARLLDPGQRRAAVGIITKISLAVLALAIAPLLGLTGLQATDADAMNDAPAKLLPHFPEIEILTLMALEIGSVPLIEDPKALSFGWLAQNEFTPDSGVADTARKQPALSQPGLKQLRDEVEKQRMRVDATYAEMSKISKEFGIIDPDPDNLNWNPNSLVSEVLSLEKELRDRQLRVKKIETARERILGLKPEELNVAMDVLGIEDPNVTQLLNDYAKARAEESMLIQEGVAPDDPLRKALVEKNNEFKKTLEETFKSVVEAQERLLQIQKRNLKDLESELPAIRDRAIATKKAVMPYIDAKTHYLQAKRILEAAQKNLTEELTRKRDDESPKGTDQ